MLKKAVAIIGTGYGLRVINSCISKTKNFYVKKIISRKKKGKLYSNKFHSILKDKQISLICLETPPFTHLDYLQKLKNFKKNILCEKPFLINQKEINFFENNKEKFNFNLLINCQLRFHPSLEKFRKMVRSFGKIKKVKILYFSNNFKEKKNDWWMNVKKGGGHLMAIGPHLLDLSNYLNGSIVNLKKKLMVSTKYQKKINTKFHFIGRYKDLSILEVISSCNNSIPKKNGLYIYVNGIDKTLKFSNFEKIILKNKNQKKIYNTKMKIADKFFNNPWRVAQYYFFKKKEIKFSNKKDKFKKLDETISNLKFLMKND